MAIFQLNQKRPLTENWIASNIIRRMIPLIMLFGLYIQFHGDFGPGGGFQAGVLFSIGYLLYAFFAGATAARALLPMSFLRFFLGFGVLIYALCGTVSLMFGKNFLDYSVFGSHGEHYGILIVELGVGVTVFSAVTSIIFILINRVK